MRKSDDGNPGRLFCFGFGYTAQALARRLAPRGWRIAGTTRSDRDAPELAAGGREIHRFDGAAPLGDCARALAGTTHLLSAVPPGPAGDPVLAHHADDIAACGSLRWIGYLSTTGVYGDRAGGWVDEESSLLPTGERGCRRLEAERAWCALWRERGLPVHRFRLAGIYGPGRSPLEALRAGRAQRIDKPGQVFSRIHVDDAAAVLEASMARPFPGRAYNVCDDDPAPPAEVVAHGAALLGMEPPPLASFEEARLSEMARSFYRDSKRVSNRRIKEELGVRLAYPSYREGLAALARGGRGSP